MGFTGHKSPQIHLKMLATGFPFDSVQLPSKCLLTRVFRASSNRSCLNSAAGGLPPLGMKPMTGKAEPLKKVILSPQDALRYAMSLPVATTITGMDKLEVLRQNLKIAQGFQRMSAEEMDRVRNDCKALAADGRFEHYKVSLQFDNPEARLAHGFPIDSDVERDQRDDEGNRRIRAAPFQQFPHERRKQP